MFQTVRRCWKHFERHSEGERIDWNGSSEEVTGTGTARFNTEGENKSRWAQGRVTYNNENQRTSPRDFCAKT